jgi:hypothetical protein
MSFACRAERLARATDRPRREIVGYSGKPECVRPSGEASEKVDLFERRELERVDFFDAALINNPGGD